MEEGCRGGGGELELSLGAPAGLVVREPTRIDQVLHIFADKDAIGMHVIGTRDAIRAAGYESDIYVGDAHSEVRHLAKPLEELPPYRREDSWLLFHHSMGSSVAEAVRRRQEPLLLDYHNVTPASLVGPWAPWVREELELGIEQLHELAPKSFFGVAHSSFSESELRSAGCSSTSVLPPLVDLGSFARGGDPELMAARSAERRAGGTDWLFVGRVSPHKAQHDLIKAFACFKRFFDPQARLHLIGTSLGEDYPRALWRFVTRLGLEDAVRMVGVVSSAALATYYATSDVFVCVSDHEGFCVPLVEAMQLGVPVVAYNSSAVGETVGDGGVVLDDKSPMTVATAVNRVVSDEALLKTLIEAGRRRSQSFSLERGQSRWAQVIQKALERQQQGVRR